MRDVNQKCLTLVVQKCLTKSMYSKMSMGFGFSKKEQAMYTVKNDHVLLSKKKTTANGQKSLIVYK